MASSFYVYGTGGHAIVLIDALETSEVKIRGLIDIKNIGNLLLNYSVFNMQEILFKSNDKVIIGIGNNLIRKKVVAGISGLPFGIIVHPTSILSNRVNIGEGTVILAGSTINALSIIGSHCIINTNASIDHECILGDFVHISPNATLCGAVSVGEGTHIGAGATIIPGIRIGKWSTIGAGSTIIRNVPDYATVVGNPGRIIKVNDKIL